MSLHRFYGCRVSLPSHLRIFTSLTVLSSEQDYVSTGIIYGLLQEREPSKDEFLFYLSLYPQGFV